MCRNITFFYLSQALPHDWVWITCIVLIEKLGYGLGTVGMMLYMMQELSPGRYRTAHYAFATGIMGAQHDADRDGERTHPGLAWLPGILRLRSARSLPPIIISFFAPFGP